MRDFLTNLFMIGMAIAFLWHFSIIAISGSIITREPSLAVLAFEITLLVGFVIFGLLNIVRILRRIK